jgi:hypothetical protein
MCYNRNALCTCWIVYTGRLDRHVYMLITSRKRGRRETRQMRVASCSRGTTLYALALAVTRDPHHSALSPPPMYFRSWAYTPGFQG